MAAPSTALYSIERQALKVLETEFEKYSETQVLSPSYVSLLKATYDMVMKGAAHRAGIDTSKKSPREILVELQQLVSEFEELVRLENEQTAEGTLQ